MLKRDSLLNSCVVFKQTAICKETAIVFYATYNEGREDNFLTRSKYTVHHDLCIFIKEIGTIQSLEGRIGYDCMLNYRAETKIEQTSAERSASSIQLIHHYDITSLLQVPVARMS